MRPTATLSVKNQPYLSYNTPVDDLPKSSLSLRYRPGLDKLLVADNVLVGAGTLDGDVKLKKPAPTNGVALEFSREYFHPRPTRSLTASPLLPSGVQTR